MRFSISVFALLGLAAGYAASQYAFFNGRALEFSQAVDQPAVKVLALLLLALAVVFAFIPETGEARK